MMMPCLIEAEPITLAMRENFGPAIGSVLNFLLSWRRWMVASISGSNNSSNVGGVISVNAIFTPEQVGLQLLLWLPSGPRSKRLYRHIVIAVAFKALSA